MTTQLITLSEHDVIFSIKHAKTLATKNTIPQLQSYIESFFMPYGSNIFVIEGDQCNLKNINATFRTNCLCHPKL